MAWAGITLVESAPLIYKIAGPDYGTLLNLKWQRVYRKKWYGLAGVRIKMSGLNMEICM